ncbi:MAG: tyrosine-type recombinase/integrase [Pirellulales bacterium]|nr:tyrosine-type recombinase/integrase [Pirellulales bacterium]
MQDNDRNARPEREAYEQVGEYVRIFRRGNTWYANLQHEGKQHRQSLKTKSKKEARHRALRLESAVRDGGIKRPPEAPTIVQVIDAYQAFLEMEGRSPSTLAKYRPVLQRLLLFAARRQATKITEIDLRLVDAYRQARLAAGTAPITVHNDAVTIKQLMDFALSRGMIAKDPLQGIKLKKPPKRPQPWWTWEEVQTILAAAREPQRAMLTVLAETGMRIGEEKHLTWEDVDFQHGFLLIQPKEFVDPQTGQSASWEPKTRNRRAIPMNPVVRAVLEQLPRKSRWVFTAGPSPKYPKGDHYLSERRLLQYLKGILNKLGLEGHLHTFRHSLISHALTSGIPPAIVQQWAGHLDPNIIKEYTHVADRASQAAMQRLSEENHNATNGKERENAAEDSEAKQAQNKHSHLEERHGESAT